VARAKSAKRKQRKNQPHVHGGWYVAMGLLFGAIGFSGLTVVENANQMRGLYETSGTVQLENDGQLAEFSRLRLEVGALTSLPKIERIARDELDMEFPETIEQVLD